VIAYEHASSNLTGKYGTPGRNLKTHRHNWLFILLLLVLLPAAHGAPLVVGSTADSRHGDPRDTVAGANAGDTITFAVTLSGQTITLTSGPIGLDKDLIIDGSALASVIRISGNLPNKAHSLDGAERGCLRFGHQRRAAGDARRAAPRL